jgi:peptidyl-prolyl isomerase D
MSNLTPDEQVDVALKHKEDGNGFFKEGNYQKALAQYHKVFLYVNGLSMGKSSGDGGGEAEGLIAMAGGKGSSQVPDSRVDEVKALKQSTYLNMAACYIKREMYEKAVGVCTKALEIGANPKASFRRGQARMALGDLDGARVDLNAAAAANPTDRAVLQEIRRLEAAEKKAIAKEKKKFQGFFDRLKSDEPAADSQQAVSTEKLVAAESPAVDGAGDAKPDSAEEKSTAPKYFAGMPIAS